MLGKGLPSSHATSVFHFHAICFLILMTFFILHPWKNFQEILQKKMFEICFGGGSEQGNPLLKFLLKRAEPELHSSSI